MINSIGWNHGIYLDVGTSLSSSESAKANFVDVTSVKVQRNDIFKVNAREISEIMTRMFFNIDNQTELRDTALVEKNTSRKVIA